MSEQLLKQILDELKGANHRLSNVENRFTNVEDGVGELKATTSRIEAKQQVIYEQTGKLSEYHTELKNGLEDVKDRLHFNTHKLTETELEILNKKT